MGTAGATGGPVARHRSAAGRSGDRSGDRSGGLRDRRRPAEVVAVGVGSLLTAIVSTWPLARSLGTAVPSDPYNDSWLIAWQVAWGGHALRTDPTGLADANVFWPEPDSYFFTDSFLGYAPTALLGSGVGAALLRYNLLLLFAIALAAVGAYALARALGARWPGAALAGAAFAAAPWRLDELTHLHVLSTGGIALSLALLVRGHGWSMTRGYEADRVRPGVALAGWLVACWQLTIGFGLGLVFAYAVAAVLAAAVIGWLLHGRPRPSARLLGADGAGTVLFGVTGLLMAMPYLAIAERFPGVRRPVTEIANLSPRWTGLFVGPESSTWYGSLHADQRATMFAPTENTVLIGFVVMALAVVGLVVSVWSWRQRLVLLAVGAAVTVLALGVHVPGGGRYSYLLLHQYAPGWDGLRTPGRLVLYLGLVAGVLAAGAVDRVAGRLRALTDRRVLVAMALLVPTVLVVAEGHGTTRTLAPSPPPIALRDLPGPVLVLPTTQAIDQLVMVWTIDGFPEVANGRSGFVPPGLNEIRSVTANAFPDATSVALLRERGIRTVVVDRRYAVGDSPWAGAADADVTGLPLTRRDEGDVVVFVLT